MNMSPRPGRGRTRFSRRSFLAGAGAAGALSLTGCGISRSGGIEYDLGSGSQVRILTWGEYIDPDVIPLVEGRAGMTVQYVEEWEDNIEQWNGLVEPVLGEGNQMRYDILVPTSWIAARMVDRGWAEPVPIEVIGNHVNIDPAFLTQGWDRGARFQMPWQSGITGLAFNTDKAAAVDATFTGVGDLFNPAYAGRVGMIGELREALGLVMLWLGDDPSRPTEATTNRAMDRLEELNAQQRFVWVFDDFVAGLNSKGGVNEPADLLVSMAWSGNAALAQSEGSRMEFVVPEEGGIQWFDTMVIPKGSPNILGAGKWMNEVYDPIVAAQITAWNQYLTPVIGVREELLRSGQTDLANNPLVFPDDETQGRLFSFAGSLAQWEPSADLEGRFTRMTA